MYFFFLPHPFIVEHNRKPRQPPPIPQQVLDYRTVSTQHATVTFRKGQFLFRDLSSSNGSMLNLRQPLRLPYNQWVRLRYGRSIVALKAKRSWVRRKLSSMTSTLAGAAAAATGGGGQHHQQHGGGGGGGRESWGGGHAGARMSVSQHLNIELLLQQQQHQQQQQQRGSRQVEDSSSSASAASSSDATGATGTGGGGTNSTASPARPAAVVSNELELLDALCRIDMTPRPRSGLGASGLLTPGGGRFYQSIAGESMSPGAVSAALFQLHLQAASSRRVFDGEVGGDGGEAGGGAEIGGGAGAGADESVYEDAVGGQEEAEQPQQHQHQYQQQPPQYQQRKPRPASLTGTAVLAVDGEEQEQEQGESRPKSQPQPLQQPQQSAAAVVRQVFHGVQFIPADSPGDSQLSELGR
jgi:hypothetical protein